MSNQINIHELAVPRPFCDVRREVHDILKSAGMTIFAEIDHAVAAKDVGLELPATVVIVYGNPKGGTPVMQEFPNAALDLPLRVLLRETSPSATVVALHPIADTLKAAGAPPELAERLSPGQRLLLDRLQPSVTGKAE
ncbi:DUF302 domain-containing protein [Rhizobium sp. RAF36]|uniref:DUF302 domain-containing protein n=1 Tax=Rhizobium sp. RAF36 TaxID=3233055 RepID=UPI003F9A1477